MLQGLSQCPVPVAGCDVVTATLYPGSDPAAAAGLRQWEGGAMIRPDPRNVCDGCRQSLDQRLRSHVELGPIVHDRIWQQLANADERLCDSCMYQRACNRLGRVLTLADLRPCRWNLYGQPNSWFDIFVEVEGTLPSNLDEWRSVGEPGEFAPVRMNCRRRRDGMASG
jgi:hypothetical protein